MLFVEKAVHEVKLIMCYVYLVHSNLYIHTQWLHPWVQLSQQSW